MFGAQFFINIIVGGSSSVIVPLISSDDWSRYSSSSTSSVGGSSFVIVPLISLDDWSRRPQLVSIVLHQQPISTLTLSSLSSL